MNRITLVLLPFLLLTLWSCSSQPPAGLDECSRTSGSPDQRIASCTRLIDSGQLSSQDRATAFHSRGIAWADKRDQARAIADYNEALRINPLYAMAYFHRFMAQQKQQSVAGSNAGSNTVPSAPSTANPKGAADYTKQGNTSPNVGSNTPPPTADPKDAAGYSKSGDASPNAASGTAPPPPPPSLTTDPKDAAGYNKRGIAWAEKRDYDRAIADYNEALRLNPKYQFAYYNRGIAWRNKGDYDRAIADYNEAVRLNPKDADAFNNRGIAWANKRDYDKAIADYSEALRLNPKDFKAYNNRGFAWANKRDYDRAIAEYNEALRVNPQYAFAYYNRANAWRAKRDYDRALADFSEALRIDPQYAFAYYNRGNVWNDKGDYSRALADYNEALRLNPKAAGIHNSAAWLLATAPVAGVRNGARAVELARKAAELSNSKDADIMDTLAAAYAEAGVFSEAIRWQEKSLEFPEFAKTQGDAARKRIELYRKGQPYHRSAKP